MYILILFVLPIVYSVQHVELVEWQFDKILSLLTGKSSSSEILDILKFNFNQPISKTKLNEQAYHEYMHELSMSFKYLDFEDFGLIGHSDCGRLPYVTLKMYSFIDKTGPNAVVTQDRQFDMPSAMIFNDIFAKPFGEDTMMEMLKAIINIQTWLANDTGTYYYYQDAFPINVYELNYTTLYVRFICSNQKLMYSKPVSLQNVIDRAVAHVFRFIDPSEPFWELSPLLEWSSIYMRRQMVDQYSCVKSTPNLNALLHKSTCLFYDDNGIPSNKSIYTPNITMSVYVLQGGEPRIFQVAMPRVCPVLRSSFEQYKDEIILQFDPQIAYVHSPQILQVDGKPYFKNIDSSSDFVVIGVVFHHDNIISIPWFTSFASECEGFDPYPGRSQDCATVFKDTILSCKGHNIQASMYDRPTLDMYNHRTSLNRKAYSPVYIGALGVDFYVSPDTDKDAYSTSIFSVVGASFTGTYTLPETFQLQPAGNIFGTVLKNIVPRDIYDTFEDIMDIYDKIKETFDSIMESIESGMAIFELALEILGMFL
nr:hypothetical protein [Wenzhou hepe-like virus 1]